MRKLVTSFVKYPFYANLIVLFLLIAGGAGLFSMKKAFFPEMTSKTILISISYPGASPKEMEESMTVRIEEAVRGIVGIKEINSTSSENFASVNITTTGEYDIDETLTEVKNSVDSISSFPVDAERPVVRKIRSRTQAMYMGLSGDVDLQTLKKYANQIEDDLLASGVVSQLTVSGYPTLEISVETTENDLLRYGLTFDEIASAISKNNRDISAGMIKSDNEEILIRSRSRTVDPNIIGDIILRANENGSVIRIRDIASVKLKFADVTNKSLMNGKQSVSFAINKLPEEDLEVISKYILKYINNFNGNHEDVKLTVTFDFLSMLKARLNLLYRNGLIGLGLVILCLGFFLSFRLSMWVAWGIPASFLAMFIVASFYGITINMISLFGMILVIGILVDDGIVIAENIYTHFEQGKSPKKAAIDGTLEVLPAVVTSVTTTIVAFTPLLLLEGRMEMLFEMAFVVIFSLFFSLFEAFFVLPAHIGNPHVLRSRKRASLVSRIRGKVNIIVNYMKNNMYGKLLTHIIEWKWIVIACSFAIFLITTGMLKGGLIKATFFPSIPFDSFNVNIAFKPGDGEKQTNEYLQRFDKAVWDVNKQLMNEFDPENTFVTYTFLNLGNGFDGQENGSHTGNISVLLRDMEGSPISSFEIAARVRKKIGQIPEAEKFTVGGRNRWGSPVSISLLGKNLEELLLAKKNLENEMEEIPALSNITDNNAVGKREVLLKLKPEAYFLGLDHAAVSNQVRQGFYGGQAQRLQSGKDELRVWVRYPKEERVNMGQLENMKIKTREGEYPLTEIATYEIKRGPVSIKRYNGQREIKVDADTTDPYEPVPPLLQQIRSDILPGILARYPGVRTEFQGQQKDSQESMTQMISLFGGAFAVILFILMIHFRSFLQPFIILMMIPLAWVGAAWGHWVEGIPISILSAWGMIALSGVIINDAVVFLSKFNSNLEKGMQIKDAVFDTGLSRFRPIVLTSLTTVAGLYPIVLETSFQAQFLKPMAVSLAFGVLFGTFFILVFLPVLILLLNDFKVLLKWILTGEKLEPEMVETAVINQNLTID